VTGREPLEKVVFDFDAVFQVDDYMYFYEDSLTDERSDAEVASLVELLELDPPLRILDLACGFGRHANRLAALGHVVTGVDVTAGFLEIAREGATAMDVEVDYRQGDMRDIDFVEAYDCALMLFTAFGYFDDDENLQVLQNIARALKPGGLLGFDCPNRDATLKALRPYNVAEKEGNLMINRSSFDMLTGRWENRRIVIRDGVRKDKPFSIRLYNATEIRDLVGRAGLEVLKICCDWEGNPLSAETRGMVVVARKPAPGGLQGR
jgi:SAM-dependent methyltransferase